MSRSFLSRSILCVVALAAPYSAQANYMFTTIDYPDGASSAALAIGNAGQIVGEYRSFGGLFHAFVLSGGVFTSFDYPASTGTSALGINSLGHVVGIFGDSTFSTRAFLHVGDDFTELVPSASSTLNRATSINDAGHVVGSYRASGADRGYLFNGTGYTTIHRPGAFASIAHGISNTETIVGAYNSAGQVHGFLLSGGIYTTIDYPGATYTEARCINDSGQIAGHYQNFDGLDHGFVRSGGSYLTVDVPGAIDTEVRGINNAGQLAGYFDDATGRHGFLAIPTLDGDFNVDGSVDGADYVVRRKNDGTQTGYDAWRANFGRTLSAGSGSALSSAESLTAAVPEPSSFAIVLVGVVGLLARVNRFRPKPTSGVRATT